MGSYGIGVSRGVAALAEQTHDERGLCRPREVVPADVHILATGKDGQISAALQLGGELEERRLRVLVDDRSGVSAGVKFTRRRVGRGAHDPRGRQGFGEGIPELRDRRTGEREEIGMDRIIGRLTAVS